MELRSRSRSKTPYIESNISDNDDTEFMEDSNEITRTTRRTTYKISGNTTTKTVQNLYKTSDYSSEEGEADTSARHITENDKNQIIEDARAAANGSSGVSALNLYRKAGRYWDKYPKTDWTYSPHSRDRVEIAPGVVQMPNMSRRTIHSFDKYTNTETEIRENYANVTHNVRSHQFLSNNNEEVHKLWKSKHIVVRIFMSIFTLFYHLYRIQNSWLIWIAKKVHRFASGVMLIDTWILRRNNSKKTLRGVILLSLIPLLLFAGWWLLSGLGCPFYERYFNSSVIIPTVEVINKNTITLDKYVSSNNVKENVEINEKNTYSPSIEQIASSLSEEQLKTIASYIDMAGNLKLDSLIDGISISNLNRQHSDDLKSTVNELKVELNKVKMELAEIEKNKYEEMNMLLNKYRLESSNQFVRLTHQLNRCCRKPIINLENYINKIVNGLVKDQYEQLKVLFVAKNELELHLTNVTQALNDQFDLLIKNNAQTLMEEITKHITIDPVSDQKVKDIVKAALSIYDADKTGLVDYAMEPMGGQVITTRCTESYHSGTAVLSVLGIPLWYPSISPRSVITPGINPGECWSFQNFPGFIVVKLASRITVEAFSIEHISKLLVPGGRIDSAPKDFEVYGLMEDNDKTPIKLGEYLYDINGDSLQFFAAFNPQMSFDIVELRIKSNHGNPNYTCLYRFRVHGRVT